MSLIKIKGRLAPFSHLPQTRCLVPGSGLLVEAFPAKIQLKTLKGELLKEIVHDVHGPLKRFTVVQNLSRRCVTIFSESYRMHVLASGEILFSKNPHTPALETHEQLSLGVYKKQDWEGMRKRRDFRELFPIWFGLGSLLTLPKRTESDVGMFSLIKACREALAKHKPEQMFPLFSRVFLAGFEGLFVPRLQDTEFQGILPVAAPIAQSSPLYLLQEGAQLIRSLFFTSLENQIAILPNLPPECFSGRFCQLQSAYGQFDLEWSKKQIRRVVIRPSRDGQLDLCFPALMRRYRVRRTLQEKGKFHICGEPLEIKSGVPYLLDQFQK